MTTQSDESSESLALYTLVQIGVQSLRVRGYAGVPPISLVLSPKKWKNSEWDKLLFYFFKTTHLQWLSWGEFPQRDPVAVHRSTGRTCSYAFDTWETAWVLLGARVGQYQGLFAVTHETFRGNVAVARMSLSLPALQVFRQFVCSTRYVALGCPLG